jgi:hypothetical protein
MGKENSVLVVIKEILACLEAELLPLNPLHGFCIAQRSAV